MPSRKRTGPGRRGLPPDFGYGHPSWMKPIFREQYDGDGDESYSSSSESEAEEKML